jgi:hypothetical protein
MKVAGVLIMILALVIGIVPQVTDCAAHGRTLALAAGGTTLMKCHWSAMAEIALAVPLFVLGALMAFGRSKENKRNLGIMGTVLGALVILVPTTLIGVCANNMMTCRSLMLPTLILSGTIVAGISLATMVTSIRSREQFA